jgi:cytochrome P450
MIAPTIVIGSISKHLAQDKELQERLRRNPEEIPAAVEEFIRLYVPYRSFSRTVSEPVNISGQVGCTIVDSLSSVLIDDKTVVPNQPIALTYTAANRDPQQFPDPDKFILNRENISSHLGFGKGRHRCVGMPLARLAVQIFLRVLLRTTNDFEVNENEAIDFARMPEMGIISCPMFFKAS